MQSLAPSPTREAATSLSLHAALQFALPGTTHVEFTDWAQLKRHAGFPDLTSQSPDEDRDAFMRLLLGSLSPPVPPEEAVLSRLIPHLQTQRDLWGFSALDLEWEAMIQAQTADGLVIGRVLQLREDFDLGALGARFDEREYRADVHGTAVVRTHDISAEDWARAPMEMLNVAILADEGILVLAALPERLAPILDAAADQSLGASARAPFETAAQALDNPTAAMLIDGSTLCTQIDPDYLPVSDVIRAEIEAAAPLNLYAAWAVGYSTAHRPIGRMVFVYDSEALAEADLPGRTSLATAGTSIEVGTYAQRWFTVVEAGTTGPLLTIDVTPSGSPSNLFGGVYLRDMTYATCALSSERGHVGLRPEPSGAGDPVVGVPRVSAARG